MDEIARQLTHKMIDQLAMTIESFDWSGAMHDLLAFEEEDIESDDVFATLQAVEDILIDNTIFEG